MILHNKCLLKYLLKLNIYDKIKLEMFWLKYDIWEANQMTIIKSKGIILLVTMMLFGCASVTSKNSVIGENDYVEN